MMDEQGLKLMLNNYRYGVQKVLPAYLTAKMADREASADELALVLHSRDELERAFGAAPRLWREYGPQVDEPCIMVSREVRTMSETVKETQPVDWLADSPLGMEAYLAALESEQAYQSTLDHVLSQMRRRLDLPADRSQSPPSADQVRALFARYQRSAPPHSKRLSQMVVGMREEGVL